MVVGWPLGKRIGREFLNERERNQILWVRAVEEADEGGALLSPAARDRASRRARPLAPPDEASPEAFLVARAELLDRQVATAEPGLEGALEATQVPSPWLFVLLGLFSGLALEVIGGDPRINLLALPLLGVLAWNALLFVVEFVRLASGRPIRFPRWLRGFLSRVRLRRAGWIKEGEAALRAAVVARFGMLWVSHGAEPAALRLRAGLHLAGLGFAAGIVAGLYTAGFALAYRATWESTFLDAEGALRFLRVLLAPGVNVLGFAFPTVTEFAALEAPGSGPAANWIHLWAVSLAVWIGAPRALFAGVHALRARRDSTQATLDLDDPYYHRLLAWREAGGRGATVIPYSTQLAAGAAASLRELLFELLGNRTQVRLADPVPYSGALPELGNSLEDVVVLVFNLAQSPEQEVHGRIIEELQEKLRGRGRLLVLLDEESYAAKADEGRLLERRRSWQRVARESGIVAVPFAGETRLARTTLDAASRELGVSRGNAA